MVFQAPFWRMVVFSTVAGVSAGVTLTDTFAVARRFARTAARSLRRSPAVSLSFSVVGRPATARPLAGLSLSGAPATALPPIVTEPVAARVASRRR